MPLKHFFWHRQPAIDAALLKHFADFLGPGKLVVDVGAGYDPWPYATEFVDYDAWPQLAGKRIHILDVELDRLPYADKGVDFLYCRHTIEDLHNPTLLLREMNRVAKAGYIETPSPLAEFHPQASGENANTRGYSHHHWFCWMRERQFTCLPKMPILETANSVGGLDDRLTDRLSADPLLWNTYLPWIGHFDFKVLLHPRDFSVVENYGHCVLSSIQEAEQSLRRFESDFGVSAAAFIPSRS